MASDAMKFNAEERITLMSSLESYCLKVRTIIEDEKWKDKIGEAERKAIMDECFEFRAWLDSAEEDEYKQEEVIISKHFFIN